LSASGAAKAAGHIAALAITGVMMTALVSYTIYVTRTRRLHMKSAWRRGGPLFLALLAAVLILLEPARHVVMDNTGGVIDGVDLRWLLVEYRDDCDVDNPTCFALGGWLFTFLATYSGFVLLMASTLWLVDIRSKIREIRAKWRSLRK